MTIVLSQSDRAPKNKAQKLEGAEKARSMIRPASEISDYLKLCVYARNGMGKTTFIGSSNLKTLIIDCNERGSLAVRKRDNVDIYPLQYWEELEWVYWMLKAGKHDYQVVGIDTITMLAVIGMKWVLGDEASRDASRDPLMPDKRHWGKLGESLKNAIINFRNLPMHVIFTAQEKTTTLEDDESGGTIQETHPELSPSPRSTLLGAVDIAGRLYTREVTNKAGKKIIERRMLVGPHPRYVSKDRSGQLGLVQRRPTLDSYIQQIMGKESNAHADEE
jgi:phage nucleotide-binding protein